MAEDILSVGVDVGTTTTQLVFSSLTLEDTGSYFTAPRAEIVATRVVFRSGIHYTPFLDGETLDGDALRALMAEEYHHAGHHRDDTVTGAVIITGEAARKENAKAVVDGLSGFAGDFVVATAGPDLESVIAGKGSGAQQFSTATGLTIANLDIGGGTTNIAVFSAGELVAATCYDIGGRHVTIDGGNRIRHISRQARRLAEAGNIDVGPHSPVTEQALFRLVEIMNGTLVEALGLATPTGLAESMRTAGSAPCPALPKIDAVSFSGGVADCVYQTEEEVFRYGDIGPLLGRAIAKGRLVAELEQHRPRETIRATVIGAGSHSVTVSGSTICCSSDALPRKNLPVFIVSGEMERSLYAGASSGLSGELGHFLRQRDAGEFVFSLRGRSSLSYRELANTGEVLAAAMDENLPAKAPLYVSIETDMAKALGQCLEKRLAGRRQAVCFDGIRLSEGDYVDIGRPLLGGIALPVVVKTLIFGK